MSRCWVLGCVALALVLAQWRDPLRAEVGAWAIDHVGIGVSDHAPGVPGTPGGTAPAAGVAGVQYYAFWTLGWSDAGWCRVRRYTTDPDLAAAYNYGLQHEFANGNAHGSAGECPATPQAPNPTAPPTPDQLAQDFWDVRLLPAPTLTMSPDYAVTGKPVYLQVGGDQSLHFDVANPIGAGIAIDTSSRYVVDWGDGAVETTTSRGGPWPNGDLTHTYTTTAEARTIRVAQHWSAAWRSGDAQGTLETLQTSAVLTFRVTQVQAVRN